MIDGVSATYDDLGNLAEQDGATWNQEFLYDENRTQIGGAVGQNPGFAYFPLPGGAQFESNPEAGLTLYAHPDWLGSARLHSTTTGQQRFYADTAFAPFGETYANTNSSDPYHFAGYPLDFALGLYDTSFREYQTTQGRWVTPDPAGLAAVSRTKADRW